MARSSFASMAAPISGSVRSSQPRRLLGACRSNRSELIVRQVHPLGAEARQCVLGCDPGRHLPRQLVEHRQTPATRNGDDLVHKILADAGQFVEVFTLGQHVGDIARQLTDQPRRPAIGAHAERVGALEVEQIATDGDPGV